MEPNTQEFNQTKTPILPVELVQKVETVEPKKGGGFLIVLLSILLIISVLIAGFFAYQTQNLVKEIAKFQISPTPIASVEPSPTADPTINWKTYTNTKLGISFKYPTEYSLLKESPNIELGLGRANDATHTYLTISQKFSVDLDSLVKCNKNSTPGIYCLVGGGSGTGQDQDVADTNLNNILAKSFYISGGVDNDFHIIQTTQKPPIELKMYVAGGGLDRTFDQILSTFKFTDEVVCTADAKTCPDGSSVGRSGPKCEFAPCPTTSPQPQLPMN